MEFRRSILKSRYGIFVKDEEAMPVGEKPVSEDWKSENKKLSSERGWCLSLSWESKEE